MKHHYSQRASLLLTAALVLPAQFVLAERPDEVTTAVAAPEASTQTERPTLIDQKSLLKPLTLVSDKEPDKDSLKKSLSELEMKKLDGELREIFGSVPIGSPLSDSNLARLSALVPRLRAAGKFWDAVGGISADQLGNFKDEDLSELTNLDYKNGTYRNPVFLNAYRVANWLGGAEIGSIALVQLSKQRAFVYPDTSAIDGWPTADQAEYLRKGNQGVLAAAVVRWGDELAMRSYWKMLESASSDSQRVLIWALGLSPRLEDFDLLLGLKAGIQSNNTVDTLINSLNRIPNAMENVARSPETTSIENRPADPEELLRIAEHCRKRLSEINLVVEPSLYNW